MCINYMNLGAREDKCPVFPTHSRGLSVLHLGQSGNKIIIPRRSNFLEFFWPIFPPRNVV